jgi:hypothetical protein
MSSQKELAMFEAAVLLLRSNAVVLVVGRSRNGASSG